MYNFQFDLNLIYLNMLSQKIKKKITFYVLNIIFIIKIKNNKNC